MAGVLIGLGLLTVAAIVGYDAMTMRVPPIYAKVGPQVFPSVVACGLALAGLLTLREARRGKLHQVDGETDWRAILIMAAGLLIHLNLLKPAGFIPAGIILFMSTAFGFGSRSYMRDFIIAVLTVSAAYFCFTQFLGLQLPPGLLKGLF